MSAKVGTSFHPRTEVERLFAGEFRELEAAIPSVHAFLFKLKKGGFVALHHDGLLLRGDVLVLRDFSTRGRKLDVQRDPANTLTYLVADSGQVVGRVLVGRHGL